MQARFQSAARSSHILRAALLAAAGLLALAGCGDDVREEDGAGGSSSSSPGPGTGAGAGVGGEADPGGDLEELHPDAEPLPGQAECIVRVRSNIPVAAAHHLPICTEIDYPTSPPSGGDHWPRWAAFDTYDAPIRHEILTHDLEHGAILMLHDCADCGSAITDAFADAQEEHGIDQKCVGTGPIARFLVAPDPALDYPLAMSAWGATYNATCIDPPSIQAFVEAHYGRATEDICAPGIDPSSISCP